MPQRRAHPCICPAWLPRLLTGENVVRKRTLKRDIDGHDGHRIYVEDEQGGFRNENGTRWSPPIRSIPKR